MQTLTWKIEVELSGAGSGWTDITEDVFLHIQPIEHTDGSLSVSPTALIAEPGTLQFALDNGISNSAGKPGYYTPGHADVRTGFAKKIRVRYSIISGVTTYYQNVYWILEDPVPTFGLFGEAVTRVKCTDWLGVAMNTPMPTLAVQTSKRGDQLITTAVAEMSTAPIATDYETGDSTFESAFDRDDTKLDSMYSILSKICRSEFGRIYIQPATSGSGAVLTFENRNARLGNATSLGTISSVMEGVEIISAENTYDQVKVSITPRKTDTSNVTLCTLTTHLGLGPGESKTFDLYYVDPNGGNRISGSSIVDPPVADTDYKFGTVDNGTSNDLNAYLTVTMNSIGGNSSNVTLTNSGSVYGYVNLFKLRGLGIYSYNEYTATAGGGGLKVLTFDMPYQSSALVADSLANYLYSIVSSTSYRGAKVTIEANKSAALMTAALTGLVSTRWTISEALTGFANDWFINGRRCTMALGNIFTVEWYVVPAQADLAWVLDTSELENDTRLAV